MKKDLIKSVILALLSLWVWSCTHEEAVAPEAETPADARQTPMTFAVVHPAQRVRVVNDAFEDGDQVGVFVHATDTPLEIGGNLVNNEALRAQSEREFTFRTTIGELMGLFGEENVKALVQEKTAAASRIDDYDRTLKNVARNWFILMLFAMFFALLAVAALEMIDRDKR